MNFISDFTHEFPTKFTSRFINGLKFHILSIFRLADKSTMNCRCLLTTFQILCVIPLCFVWESLVFERFQLYFVFLYKMSPSLIHALKSQKWFYCHEFIELKNKNIYSWIESKLLSSDKVSKIYYHFDTNIDFRYQHHRMHKTVYNHPLNNRWTTSKVHTTSLGRCVELSWSWVTWPNWKFHSRLRRFEKSKPN